MEGDCMRDFISWKNWTLEVLGLLIIVERLSKVRDVLDWKRPTVARTTAVARLSSPLLERFV